MKIFSNYFWIPKIPSPAGCFWQQSRRHFRGNRLSFFSSWTTVRRRRREGGGPVPPGGTRRPGPGRPGPGSGWGSDPGGSRLFGWFQKEEVDKKKKVSPMPLKYLIHGAWWKGKVFFLELVLDRKSQCLSKKTATTTNTLFPNSKHTLWHVLLISTTAQKEGDWQCISTNNYKNKIKLKINKQNHTHSRRLNESLTFCGLDDDGGVVRVSEVVVRPDLDHVEVVRVQIVDLVADVPGVGDLGPGKRKREEKHFVTFWFF